jgi:hypothetical protein
VSGGARNTHERPAAPQKAAADTPRFPVEDTTARSKPKLRATFTVTATYRSLKDHVGFAVSFLK